MTKPNHTPEHVRGPRRRRAGVVKGLTQQMLNQGQISPACCVPVPPDLPLAPFGRSVAHRVLPTDAYQAALASEGRVGVLVFGSARQPGGGWENGAKAQEEDLSLVSTWGLQATLSTGFYQTDEKHPMGPDAVLVAEGAWLLDEQGQPLPTPVPVVLTGLAAPNRSFGQLKEVSDTELQNHLSRRLVVALDAWHDKGVETGILGAIGCGVFQWPPSQSAHALRVALNSTRWKGTVVLAMPDPAMADVFATVLNQLGQTALRWR